MAEEARPTGEVWETLFRNRWRTALVAAALVAPHALLDLRHPNWKLVVAIRACWVAMLLAGYQIQRRGVQPASSLAAYVVVLASGAAVIGIVALTGGSRGPRFDIIMPLPLALLVMIPDLPWGAIGLGMLSFAGGIFLLVRDGRDAWWITEWTVLSGTLAAVVAYGAYQFGRLRRVEQRAAEDRAQALALLAESERRRGQTERLALAGRLAAGVAHEINNPLAFVKSNLRALQRKGEGGLAPEEEVEVLRESLLGVERIARIVADLRNLARGGPEELAPCDLPAVADEALRLASGRLSHSRVSCHVPPDLPRPWGSHRLLVQALVNLLVNAGDAVAEASPEQRWVSLAAAPEDGAVVVRVEDGGPGLPSGVLARLFEPFQSTKGTAGTGLGLALTLEQLQRCGGTIEGANRDGGGAVFTIRLRTSA
jgi:C4-dicarboxylate-specific signal transduction histidine kinase